MEEDERNHPLQDDTSSSNSDEESKTTEESKNAAEEEAKQEEVKQWSKNTLNPLPEQTPLSINLSTYHLSLTLYQKLF